MPADDDQLRDALRAAAREPSVGGVAERVHAKRAHRRTVQRVQRGAVAFAVLAGVVAVGIVALDESTGEHRQEVAVRPDPGSFPEVRVIDGGDARDARVRRIRVEPDEGYVRGPMIVSGGDGVTLAAYDRSGETFTFPPSRVVRVDLEGTVTDVDVLQGEILALAEGEGARWALTHDKTVTGPGDPEFRVKRIGPSGDVVSNAVPIGEQPLGRITAGGGGVWVPVADGVLRFDTVTGAFATKITLPGTAEQRAVSVGGKFVFVTDANTIVRLDPASATPGEVVGEVPAGIELVDAAPATASGYLLGFDASSGNWVVSDGARSLTLHESFEAASIHAVGDVVWVDGIVDGVRTLVVLNSSNIELAVRTIRISNEDDASVVLTSGRSLIVASRGSLFAVRLPT